jgi:hypothetical protein
MKRTHHSTTAKNRKKPFDKVAYAKAMSRAAIGQVPATKFHSTVRGAKDYNRRNGKKVGED